MDRKKIFEYALQREHEGKRFFVQNADRLSNAAAQGAFKKLAEEEQRHIEFIEHQLRQLSQGEVSSVEFGRELEAVGFFSQRAVSEDIDVTVAEAMVADLPVLRMAYLIERDFSEFYEMAAKISEGESKTVLEMLARWERTHETLFKKMHDRAFEEYAQMPWGG